MRVEGGREGRKEEECGKGKSVCVLEKEEEEDYREV